MNTSQGIPRASQISLKRRPNAPECVGSCARSPGFGSDPYWRNIFGARAGAIFPASAAGEKRAIHGSTRSRFASQSSKFRKPKACAP